MKPSLRAHRLIAVLYLLFLATLLLAADQKNHGDPILGERISKGLVFDGKLWLMGNGGLISLDLSNNARLVHFSNGVVDMTKSGQDFWVLRQPSEKTHEVVVSAWKNEKFEDLAKSVTTADIRPIALLQVSGNPTILFSQAVQIFSFETHSWRTIGLKKDVRGGVQGSVASPVSGHGIYVGINAGEWGGGLQRVDLQIGMVANIEKRNGDNLCAGPLNSDCDPVTGVIADPGNNDCVLVATGLVHMWRTNGAILRVCGDQVTVIFEKSTDPEKPHAWGYTEAFYGLVPAPDGEFWAISPRALYRFGADGKQKMEYEQPKFKDIQGIYLNRDVPGVILLRTDVNWAVSTSGYTPLVIPLEN